MRTILDELGHLQYTKFPYASAGYRSEQFLRWNWAGNCPVDLEERRADSGLPHWKLCVRRVQLLGSCYRNYTSDMLWADEQA